MLSVSVKASSRRVNAVRLVRKMRGGAQSHLLECDDGRFWVVKFSNNPQHRRVLINEWMAAAILLQLEISTPEASIIWITSKFLGGNPDVSLSSHGGRLEVEIGPHFGSLFPGDPSQIAVYDFLPEPLLDEVGNGSQFIGVLAFDKWTGNTDGRQAIFRRKENSLRATCPHMLFERRRYQALMIDNGGILNGQFWDFPDTPLHGLYPFRTVYRTVESIDSFEPWLNRIVHFPSNILDTAAALIPPRWLTGDEGLLAHTVARLLGRRQRVPELLKNCADDPGSPFPAWRR